MNHFQVMVNTLFAIACTILVSTKSFAEPANLSQLKSEITAYHQSGQYDKEFAQVIHQAQRFINNTALHNAKLKAPQKLALVLDIDETSLSNYNMMNAHHYCATLDQFHEAQQKADEPALIPTLNLYKDALKHNIAVFFITGRPATLKEATEANLKTEGFTQWIEVYYKPANYKQPSVIPFKADTRALIEQKGYKIVASIGDQQSDLQGGHAMRTFKLPNPHYYIP